MNLSHREFLQILPIAAAQGLPLARDRAMVAVRGEDLYLPGKPQGNVTLMHFTDRHAQLLPGYFREPDVNIGVGDARGPPHLTGDALLQHFGIKPGTREAHAFTHLDYVAAARTYGKIGGFAHLETLVKQIGALLLDGGDSWQGSATALWSCGQDMIDASTLLGVDDRPLGIHLRRPAGAGSGQQGLQRESRVPCAKHPHD